MFSAKLQILMLRISYGKNCIDFKFKNSLKIALYESFARVCDFRILKFRNRQFLEFDIRA